MSYRNGLFTGIAATAGTVVVLLGVWWLLRDKAAATKPAGAAPPAAVSKIVKEEQLTTITLKPEAEERLGIKTAPVVKQTIPRSRTYGGEVMIPVGKAILVASPFNGALKTPMGVTPHAGGMVKRDDPLFLLYPLLTGEGIASLVSQKVAAEGRVATAQSQVKSAEVTHEAAIRSFKGGIGTQRMVDDAREVLNVAQKGLDAATQDLKTLTRLAEAAEKGTAEPITIRSPADGMLRNVSAATGQNVPSGAALFEVVDTTTMWVRVPVYVGDLPDLDTKKDARVGNLSNRPNATPSLAKPIVAPPSANALTGTVDIFYELDNRVTQFSPGHRVGVTLQLKDEDQGVGLTVPWSAVIHDIHGGTWVYESTGSQVYVRRRVVVRTVLGGTAVLAIGPPEKTKVVIEGAAELFGAETGYSK